MDHFFNIQIATDFDIDTAIFIQHLKYWTFINLAKEANIKDGLCWSFDTIETFTTIFPYWSKRQIERVLNNCHKNGLISKGNYNKTSYDRTVWYALNPIVYGYYPELLSDKFLKLLHSTISPNGEMDFAEWRNGFPRSVTPIPDIKPNIIPNIVDADYSEQLGQNDPNLRTELSYALGQNCPSHLDNKVNNKVNTITTKATGKVQLQELIDIYHTILPDSPKILTPSDDLRKRVKQMIKRWPELTDNQEQFTLELFTKYLMYLKQHQPGFLKPYETRSGNTARNNLDNLIVFNTMAKFRNGQFNFLK